MAFAQESHFAFDRETLTLLYRGEAYPTQERSAVRLISEKNICGEKIELKSSRPVKGETGELFFKSWKILSGKKFCEGIYQIKLSHGPSLVEEEKLLSSFSYQKIVELDKKNRMRRERESFMKWEELAMALMVLQDIRSKMIKIIKDEHSSKDAAHSTLRKEVEAPLRALLNVSPLNKEIPLSNLPHEEGFGLMKGQRTFQLKHEAKKMGGHILKYLELFSLDSKKKIRFARQRLIKKIEDEGMVYQNIIKRVYLLKNMLSSSRKSRPRNLNTF